MSRTPRSADLRERMQRVATRPSRAAAVRRAPSTTTPQSRARTLAAWASWELTSVPARRWNWLMATIRGRPTS
jgi:hypothetical protein